MNEKHKLKMDLQFFAESNEGVNDDIKPKDYINSQLENNFTYHPPKGNQQERYQALRNKAKELAHMIDELCPNSREKSLAHTNLEQASMWANASIARNE